MVKATSGLEKSGRSFRFAVRSAFDTHCRHSLIRLDSLSYFFPFEETQQGNLTHVAEIISGIAIVISLVALIIELRTTNRLTRVNAYQAIARDFDEDRTLWLSNPDFLPLIVDFVGGKAPDSAANPEDASKLALL